MNEILELKWGQDTKSFGQISHVIQNVCPAVTVATLLAQKKKKKRTVFIAPDVETCV